MLRIRYVTVTLYGTELFCEKSSLGKAEISVEDIATYTSYCKRNDLMQRNASMRFNAIQKYPTKKRIIYHVIGRGNFHPNNFNPAPSFAPSIDGKKENVRTAPHIQKQRNRRSLLPKFCRKVALRVLGVSAPEET